jgi:hypothetical protein
LGSRRISVSVPDPVPARVSDWLAELPLANTQYCLDAMRATLESFNARQGLNPAVRFDLAERLRPNVLMLEQRARDALMDSPVPYPPETAVYIDSGIDLHKELGMAYALAAFDLAGSDFRAKGGECLPRALRRALEHWGLLSLWLGKAYRAPDEAYWSILYRLYRVAEARDLLALQAEEADGSGPCATPESLFKQALLFSQANVRRLRQREMPGVFKLLGLLQDRARLGAEPVLDGQMAEFFLDVGGDSPPSRTRALSGFEGADPRFLYTRALAKAMVELGTASVGRLLGTTLEKATLSRVVRSLGGMDKRKSTRRPETDPCLCICGLAALMEALNSASPFEERPTRPAARAPGSEFQLVREGEGRRPDSKFEARILRSEATLDKTLGKKLKKAMTKLSADDIWSADSRRGALSHAPPAAVEGMIVNSSSRGCCIIWPTHPSARTKVGELIGVWLEATKKLAFIGATRWLDCDGDGLTIGVELLTPSAEVADLYDSASKPKGRGLLLGAVPALRPEPELLTAPGAIPAGSVLRIRTGEGEAVGYWAREPLEATPSFVRYDLMRMDSELDGLE